MLIVGAGSAGSVLAERLSADPACRVTVVESGPGPSDPRVRTQISDGLRLPIGTASSVVRHYPTTLTDEPKRPAQIMRGAVVGGSGAVNGGYFCRGVPGDFDGWNLPGWAWADVLPHFRAIETDLDFGGPLHGSDGPILVRRVSEFDGCTASFVRSATDAGYGWVSDLNGATPRHRCRRASERFRSTSTAAPGWVPAGAFLQPAMDRTEPDPAGQHPGGADPIREGPRGRCGVRRPGWNSRLDRGSNRAVRRCNRIGTSADAVRCRRGGGAAASGNSGAGEPAGGYARVDHPEWVLPVGWSPTHDLPPLEAVLTTPDGIEIRPYTAGFGAMISGRRDDPADQPHIGVALMQPRSRGRVRLASADPAVPPIIEHRYDSEPKDVADAARRCRAGSRIGRGDTEVGTASWSTSQHLSGTAPMGADDDPAAVLDPRCRVRGVDGLWVVDGSILPMITGRGPHATIVMIGHRAVEFISG